PRAALIFGLAGYSCDERREDACRQRGERGCADRLHRGPRDSLAICRGDAGGSRHRGVWRRLFRAENESPLHPPIGDRRGLLYVRILLRLPLTAQAVLE